jgi:hypothetical protein
MAYSSILGGDRAPAQPSGRGSDVLGPSDNSDSGSDALGSSEVHGDSDAAGTGERGAVAGGDTREGADILPDEVRLARGEGDPGLDPDAMELTDLDASEAGDDDEDEDAAGR